MELNQELINRGYSRLPKKYWASQNLCWYLHDVIMSIFMEVIDEDLITTWIEFKNENEANTFKESFLFSLKHNLTQFNSF